MKIFKYVWKNDWILPYESAWGIFEKFKYTNALTGADISNLIHGNTTSNNAVVCEELQVFRNSTFNSKSFMSLFSLDNKHFAPLSQLYNNNVRDYLNHDLYVCTDCIKYGYHSYFHQLKFTDKCFIHNCKLKNISEMNKSIFYSIKLNALYAYKYERENKVGDIPMYVNIFKAPILIQNGFRQLISKIQIYSSEYLLIRIINLPRIKNIQPNDDMSQLLNCFFFSNPYSFQPILTISKENVKKNYLQYINSYKMEFDNKFQKHNKSVLISYVCLKIIKEVLSIYNENKISEVQSKLNNYISIEPENRNIATSLIFAYNVSNSRDVYDSTGNSLILHPYSHDVIHNSLNIEYISDIIIDYDDEDIFYLNLFLYEKTLFNIHEQIKEQLAIIPNIKIDNKFNFEFPQYIITQDKDNTYKVYECKY